MGVRRFQTKQPRPAGSALALGPEEPETHLAGCPWAGLAMVPARLSLHHTHPTGRRGEDEASPPLHGIQAEIGMDEIKTNALESGSRC